MQFVFWKLNVWKKVIRNEKEGDCSISTVINRHINEGKQKFSKNFKTKLFLFLLIFCLKNTGDKFYSYKKLSFNKIKAIQEYSMNTKVQIPFFISSL